MRAPDPPFPLVPPVVKLAGPDAPALCEPILRSVPEWFGIEPATRGYIADTARLPTWIAWRGGSASAFVTINRHFPGAAEVHCIAVHRDHHRKGLGASLLVQVEAELRQGGVQYLQVKTLGPSRPCPHYAMALRFYRSRGFEPLEEVHGLWPDNPALLMIKALR
jgi:ribosomal protein S18 acetylase RimI-like enzyme